MANDKAENYQQDTDMAPSAESIEDNKTPQPEEATFNEVLSRLKEKISGALSTILDKKVEVTPLTTESVALREELGGLRDEHLVLQGKVTLYNGKSFPWLAIMAEVEAAKLCAPESDDTTPQAETHPGEVIKRLRTIAETIIDVVTQLSLEQPQAFEFTLIELKPLDIDGDTSLLAGFDEQGNAIRLQHNINISGEHTITVMHLSHPDLLSELEAAIESEPDEGDEEAGFASQSPSVVDQAAPSLEEADEETGFTAQSPSVIGQAASSLEDRDSVRGAQFLPLADSGGGGQPNSIDFVLDINLRIIVELGRTYVPIREILELNPGSVVELDKVAGEPVDILANDRLIARGEVVVVDENFGVRITDILSPAKRLAATG